MFTLRCTARLLGRLKIAPEATPIEPTTKLGDWYANLIHLGRRQLVLAVSERTFLPVVVPAAPGDTLVPRLRNGLVEVLDALGVAKADVERELAQMADVAYGKTANRQVTGITRRRRSVRTERRWRSSRVRRSGSCGERAVSKTPSVRLPKVAPCSLRARRATAVTQRPRS